MDEIEVPPYFLCPISLEIMKDPVTVSTGITYERESIEKWIFSWKNNTCPVTKQELAADTTDQLTPNVTLRRLIQAWCIINASNGIERFPTPKPPVSKSQISKLLDDANKSPQMLMECLERMRSIASQNQTNKRSLEAAGATRFLFNLVSRRNQVDSSSIADQGDVIRSSDEALNLLYNLGLSESSLRSLLGRNDEFVGSLTRVMQHGCYESRAYAVMLLKSMFGVAHPIKMTNLEADIFVELVQILRDQISQKATKAALKLLIDVCPWGRNRIKAVEAGAVTVTPRDFTC